MNINVSYVLTSGAILVALATWWVNLQRQRQSETVTRTAQIIANLSTSETLAEATFQLTRIINDGKMVVYDDLDESMERHIVKILDYYEYLCELYDLGILSRTTIVNLRGRLMARTYNACQGYILETRKRQNRLVYESFERFVHSLPDQVVIPLKGTQGEQPGAVEGEAPLSGQAEQNG